MNLFLSPAPIQLHKSVATARIAVGLLITYHGLEVFDAELMKGYESWETFKDFPAKFTVYFGKVSELAAGVLLALGLFTRLAAILTTNTFSFITFFVGHGIFWYDDQHPFLFVLFGLLFFFTGPCAWSLDGLLFRKQTDR